MRHRVTDHALRAGSHTRRGRARWLLAVVICGASVVALVKGIAEPVPPDAAVAAERPPRKRALPARERVPESAPPQRERAHPSAEVSALTEALRSRLPELATSSVGSAALPASDAREPPESASDPETYRPVRNPGAMLRAWRDEPTDALRSEAVEDFLLARLPANLTSDALELVDCRRSACAIELRAANAESIGFTLSATLGGEIFSAPAVGDAPVRAFITTAGLERRLAQRSGSDDE